MKDADLRKIIESRTGIICDWKITRQEAFFNPENKNSSVSDITDDGPITHNLYLSAIKIALKCDKGSRGLFKIRLAVSFALADKLLKLLIKDGVLTHHPGYSVDTAPCDVNHEVGKRLANLI